VKALAYFIVATSFALGTSAFAATVTPIEGTVQVNTGTGFRPVSGAAEVAPGASVMVSPKGRGEIRYSDGCKTTVRPGSVAVIPPVSLCAQGQAVPYDRRCENYGQGQAPLDDRRYECVDTGFYLFAGALAAVVAVDIYEATRHNNNNVNILSPASP
jgi:hypothetical protein